MRSFSPAAILGIASLFAMVLCESAAAQVRPPAELLAAYVRERQTPNAPSSASRDLIHMLSNHGDYPAAHIESLLDGLEQIALSGTPPRLRAEAAFELSIPGSNNAVHSIRGTFTRLERVYRRSSDPLVRSVLVGAMGDLTDRREAAGFLERVATQEPSDFAEAPRRAVESLMRMGDLGTAVLKRLHETGAVHDQETKRTLAHLAKNRFRRPSQSSDTSRP